MQAVILAAGEGKRLRPLTEDRPKPMIEIMGRPILEHTLSALPKEIDEAILVIGYQGEKIKNHFGSRFGDLSLKYAFQTEPKGTTDALFKARPFLKDSDFLLLYADDLYHPDDLAETLNNGGPAILAKESDHPERFGVCLLDDRGFLSELIEKQPNPPSNLVNIGVYRLDPGIFNVPPVALPNGELNLAAQIGLWAKQKPIKVIKARFWQPIGYPEDVEAAEVYLSRPIGEWHN